MISSIPSNFPNVITPFAPLGRQPVGQENPELRNSTLKPLEQSAETARRENRRSFDERAGEPGQRLELGRSFQEAGLARSSQSSGADESSPSRQRDQKALERELEQRQQQEILQEVRELAARDREVRAHEQAHAAVGGRYAGAPTYEFTRGPDGVSYAVAGEVSIDTSKVPNDPQATIEKAQLIRRAAFAPAEPSSADRQVAAEATQMEAEARAELRQQQVEEARARVSGDTEQDALGAAQSARADENSASSDGSDVPPVKDSSGSTPVNDSLGPKSVDHSTASENAVSVVSSVIKTADRSVELSRRLIETGAQANPFPPGQLFNQLA